jgi:CHASE3 domain sensor protein
MKKIAFYRKIVFKVLITIVIILGLSFSTSYFMTTKYTNSLINSNTAKEFNNALNVIESFITFIGQTAQIWARHTVIDNELHEKITKV